MSASSELAGFAKLSVISQPGPSTYSFAAEIIGVASGCGALPSGLYWDLAGAHFPSCGNRRNTRLVAGDQTSAATTHRVPPPDRGRVLSVGHLVRPVARGKQRRSSAEVMPPDPYPSDGALTIGW